MNRQYRDCASMAFRFCALLIALSFGMPRIALATPSTATPLEIKADRLDVQQADRRAVFSGHVQIKRGSLTMTCASLEATYDDKGNLKTLKADGPVVVKGKDFAATAGNAEYSQSQGTLSLTEEPTLERGRSQVRGTRILIWLDQERVVIDKARGTLDPALLVLPKTP